MVNCMHDKDCPFAYFSYMVAVALGCMVVFEVVIRAL